MQREEDGLAAAGGGDDLVERRASMPEPAVVVAAAWPGTPACRPTACRRRPCPRSSREPLAHGRRRLEVGLADVQVVDVHAARFGVVGQRHQLADRRGGHLPGACGQRRHRADSSPGGAVNCRPSDPGHRNRSRDPALSRGRSTCSCLRAKPAQAGDAEPRGPGGVRRAARSLHGRCDDRKGRVPPMKPAWHEVVASLETSLARGSHGSHAPQRRQRREPRSRRARSSIPRGLPVTWHEPVADRAEPATPVAAPSGRAELLASLERRMNREDEGIAVALVDLDGFKALNHDHGYAAGDQVLDATLTRLQGAVGSGARRALRVRRVRGAARRRGARAPPSRSPTGWWPRCRSRSSLGGVSVRAGRQRRDRLPHRRPRAARGPGPRRRPRAVPRAHPGRQPFRQPRPRDVRPSAGPRGARGRAAPRARHRRVPRALPADRVGEGRPGGRLRGPPVAPVAAGGRRASVPETPRRSARIDRVLTLRLPRSL